VRLRTQTWFVRLLLFACCSYVFAGESKTRTEQPPTTHDSPLWSTDLKQLGYRIPSTYASYFRVGADIVKIQFLDSRRIALAWLVTDQVVEKPGLYKNKSNVPSHLHLCIIDAKTGREISSHDWPTASQGVDIADTASNQWLVASGEAVTLYSPSFEKIRELQQAKPRALYRGLTSPSGRTFLIRTTDSHGAWSDQLLDAATFEVRDSWNDNQFANASYWYSDRSIVAFTLKPAEWLLRTVGKGWAPLPSQENSTQPDRRHFYGFLNDDLLVGRSGKEISVGPAGGLPLFTLAAPEAQLFFSQLIPSQGDRFATILDRMRGLRSEPLDMYPFPAADRVLVYSIPDQRPIFSAKVKGPSPWYPKPIWNSVALSPDGELLGIVSNDGIRVYALPPRQGKH
jgi:hypothetical protein